MLTALHQDPLGGVSRAGDRQAGSSDILVYLFYKFYQVSITVDSVFVNIGHLFLFS